MDPVPDPLLLREFGSPGNRTRTSGSVARKSYTRPQRRSTNEQLLKYSVLLTDLKLLYSLVRCARIRQDIITDFTATVQTNDVR
jgi:hypothetical protein